MSSSARDTTPLAEVPGWNALRESLEALHGNGRELADFVAESFREFEALHATLAERQQQLTLEGQRLAEKQLELETLHATLDPGRQADEQARLQALEAELTELNCEMAQQQSVLERKEHQRQELEARLAAQVEQATQLAAERDAALADRQQMSSELQSVQEQAGRLSTASAELDTARSELAQARGESQRLREQLLAAQSANHGDGQLKHRLSEAEEERRNLERELEAVRQRAAEMAETLVEQKRQMAEDRAQWNTELRQLRRLLERQAELLTERTHVPAAPTAAARREPVGAAVATAAAPTRSGGVDPVLGDVMAQFERLQQDRQRRRKEAG